MAAAIVFNIDEASSRAAERGGNDFPEPDQLPPATPPVYSPTLAELQIRSHSALRMKAALGSHQPTDVDPGSEF